jgi:molybdopterin-guanine dinucleotide biosynthesis protein A
VVEDPSEGRGPLQGIAAGLERVAGRAEVAFVCSTDLPFLHPAFVGRVVRALESGGDVALPHARGHRQPLAAAYRTTLAPAAAGLVAAGRLRPAFLLEGRAAVHLDGPTLLSDPRLAAFDPELESVVNLNLPADYEAAHARPEPEVTISRFGTLALRGGRGPERLRAATVARAAAGAGVPWDRHVVAALNGDRVTHDGETPLAAGDSVAFLTADAGG